MDGCTHRLAVSDAVNSVLRYTKELQSNIDIEVVLQISNLQLAAQTALDHYQQLIEAKIGRQTARQPRGDEHSCEIHKFGHSSCYL